MSVEGRIGSSSPTHLIGGGSISSDSHHLSPDSSSSLETLDEPVSQTILRDVRRVGIKLKHVLIPRDTVKELRDWDLWGPLFLCLLLASTLSISSGSEQSALIFTAVFVIVWVGAGVITLNAVLLGGELSFLQSVCVLGYCLAPMNVASILCHAWGNKIFHFTIVLVAFIWATRASVGFMAQLVDENRRALSVYPVLLFYITIGWMILVQ